VLDLSGNALDRLPDDLGRLHRLRVLFCSANRFTRLPPALGGCPALSQIGFRGNALREVPAESLPPGLRWLTLTDNQIGTLPAALGERPALQKLLLAGNRLRHLPESLAGAPHLELVRLSANQFDQLPPWLPALPRLAWLAWAGNPIDQAFAPSAAIIDWADLELGPLLGEGASGQVHQAVWQPPGAPARPVALKLFKGAMTSDGLPEREMAACLAAGAQPSLTGALGRITGHPAQLQGLVMPLLPGHWRTLAAPPSLASCSRDVYAPALSLALPVALRIAASVAAAATHLHATGLLHGDLYAHNTLWDGVTGQAVLTDFGAASFLPAGADAPALQRTEVLAWGILLGELLAACPDPVPAHLRDLQRQCADANPSARPLMAEAAALLRH
jgi:hypothetical protein